MFSIIIHLKVAQRAKLGVSDDIIDIDFFNFSDENILPIISQFRLVG